MIIMCAQEVELVKEKNERPDWISKQASQKLLYAHWLKGGQN